jgi:zinc protease
MPNRHRLSNGLTVVSERLEGAPVTAFQVWVKAGAADEEANEIGLAHLHEHMLFKGTERYGLGEIARTVEAHGGDINAFTTSDQTVYHVQMASPHARVGLEVLADAIRRSKFDSGELTREIEVVCEEIKRSLDAPGRRAYKSLYSAAYLEHPYGRPVIGFEANVRAHTRERVLGFYNRHYVPQNVVLAAAGDLDHEQVARWAEDLFGGEWGRPSSRPPRPKEPERTSPKVSLERAAVKESHLHLAFAAPSLEHPDVPALDLLAMVLGQGSGSRLSLHVKRRQALASDVGAWAHTPKDPGLFTVSLSGPKESSLRALQEAAKVSAGLTRELMSEGELATAKAYVEAETVWHRESADGVARRMGFYESSAGGFEKEAEYLEQMLSTSREQVLAAAKKYLRFDRAVLAGLVPQDAPFSDEELLGAVLDSANAPAQVSREGVERPAPKVRAFSPRPMKKPTVVHRLKSGGTLLMRREGWVPVTALRATWPGGTRLETVDDNGLFTLMARTLVRGTQTKSAEQITERVDALAGGLSTAGGRGSFSVRGHFLSRHLESAFRLFAEVSTSPGFHDAEVTRERNRMLDDLKARDDRPSGLAFELFAKTMFQVHPYRLSMLGEPDSVAKLSPEMLHAAAERFLDPSRMHLAVVGDFDEDEVVRLAEELFVSRSTPAPIPDVPQEPAWSGRREATKELDKAQSHVVLGFPGARVNDEWRRALELLSTLMSGQGGRLFLELRDKQSLAYSVSSMALEGVDPGYFAVYMGTSPEKVPTAIAGIERELSRVVDEKVTEAELSRAREYLVGAHEVSLQQSGARAGIIALDSCYGLGPDRFLGYPDEIAKVTVDDVQAVAKRVIDFNRCTLVVVGKRQ